MTEHREDSASVSSLLRRGLVSFVGGATAGIAGLILALLVGRFYGTTGSGVFFTVVAVVMIAANVCQLGANTGLVWILPRLRVQGRAEDQRTAVRVALIPVAVISAAVTVGVWGLAGPLARLIGDDQSTAALETGLRVSAVAIAVGAISMLCVAGTRGYGLILPFIGLQNLALPLGRILLVAVVAWAGGTGTAALAGWSAAWVVIGAISPLVLLVVARRSHPAADERPAPTRTVGAELWRFSLPRAGAATLQIALVWLDVVLVAALMGPAEAGIYAILSRFITAGSLGESAVRLALAPRFSGLFTAGNHLGVDTLLKHSAPLMIALSWPVFVITALLPAEVLGLFGTGFEQGAHALAILSATMLFVPLVGPVQSALLMSGHTVVQLVNKGASLAALVVLDLLLIPSFGLIGAAIGWSVAVLVDNGLAALQLGLTEGVWGVGVPALWGVLLVGVGCSAVVLFLSWTHLSGIALLAAAGVANAVVAAAALFIPGSPIGFRRDVVEL